MASAASLQLQQNHQPPPPPTALSPNTPPPQAKSHLASPQNNLPDREAESSDQFSGSVTLQQRMDHFLSMTTAAAAAASNRIASNTKRGAIGSSNHNNNSADQGIGESYQYQDASATSGSNSGDEDDGESHQDAGSEISGGGEGGSGKRIRNHFNGYSSSKKRRKQSKPIRLSAGDTPSIPQKHSNTAEDDRGTVDSPGEIRRYSEEEELEEGERRGRIDRDEDEEYEEGARADGPLNLSSTSSKDAELVEGEEEGEVVRNNGSRGGGLQPSLRVLGAELMQANHSDGLAGLKVPSSLSNQRASSIPTSLYQGMLQFGLPPFPFPFPVTSQAGGQAGVPASLSGKLPPSMSMSSSSSGPPLSQTGRVQIFNPEAYCELCNKEFCNKYFLKTHKANKHGIYSDSLGVNATSGTGGSGAPRSSSPGGGHGLHNSSSPGPTRGGPDVSAPLGAGPPTPNSQAGGEGGSPFSGAFIAANMGSLRPPFLPLSPGASPSPTSAGTLPPSSNSAVTPAQSGKEVTSKEHGSSQRDAPSRGSEVGDREPPSSPISSASATSRPSLPPGVIPGLPPSSQPNAVAAAAAAMMFSPGGTPLAGIPDFRQSSEDRERLMGRQYFDKELGELQRSIERGSPRGSLSHLTGGAFNPLLFGGIPSIESLKKQEEGIRRDSGGKGESGSMPNIPNLTSPSERHGNGSKGPFTPDKLRQMGVINADAFCEICCKEFCNKYFLRVHKLKKHGICSPDLPPEKVQKILNQMAKEAGKTGNPPPPIVRPPMLGGPMGQHPSEKFGPMPPLGSGHPPLPNLRPSTGLMNINLPPLEPLPLALRDALPNLPPPPQLVMEAGREKERQRLLEGERDKERTDRSIESKSGEQRGRESSRSRHNPSTVNPPDINELEEGEREIIRINDDSAGEDDEEDCQISGSQNSRQKRRIDELMPDGEKEVASNGGEDLQRLQSMIMELNSNKSKAAQAAAQLAVAEMTGLNSSSTICRVCNKDMENKYFLRAHMMNEHGVLHMEDNNQISARAEAEAMRHREISAIEEDNMVNGTEHDFAAKFLQQMQKGMGGLPPSLGEPGGDEHNFLERVKAELAAASGMNGPRLGQKLLGSPGSVGDKDPNRKPASLSRSYCEICKKELCNKYFMKTHMLKMHGINIESIGSGPMGPGGAQTNSGPMSLSGGVSCHICKKELCSKYFLKVHMQNSHGIITGIDGGVIDIGPGGLPPFPPGMVENGGAVSNLFKGLFPMGGPPPELLSLPSGDQEKDRYFSRLLGEQSEISRERLKEFDKLNKKHADNSDRQTNHSCSLCGEVFPEIVALQVHIIKNHGAFPPEGSGNFGDSVRPKSPTSDGQQIQKIPNLLKKGSHNNLNEGKGNTTVSGEGIGDTTSSSGNEEGFVATRHRSLSEEVDGEAEEQNQRDDRSSTSNTPNKTTTSSNGPAHPPHLTNDSSIPPLPPGFLDKQAFPHIEILQRHMLSQQFPGLINPALLTAAGFPGFASHGNSHVENGTPASTSANSSIQQFPGLQQLLVGGKTPHSHMSLHNVKDGTDLRHTDEENEEREEGEVLKIRKSLNLNAIRKEQNKDMSVDSEGKQNHGESGRKIRCRRFKCSKCNQKFRRRDICLRHIHQTHSSILPVVPRRQLGFLSSNSPKKSIHSANKNNNAKARSQYVRQLMDLLRVPTSRGTPQKIESDGDDGSPSAKVQHIMQAFLLRAPASHSTNEVSASETSTHSIDDNGNNFVPSVVYLPVSRRVSGPMTVAFDLTPA